MSENKIEVPDFIAKEMSDKMSIEEIDKLAKMTSEATPEEVKKMQESIERTRTEGIDENDYVPEIRDISLETSYEELIAGLSEKDRADVEATVAKFKDKELTDEDLTKSVNKNLEGLDMSDEDVIKFVELIREYQKNPTMNVYAAMPSSIKSKIAMMGAKAGIPMTEWNNIAKSFVDDFITDTDMQQFFVDFEEAMDEALKMPSMTDLYSEHTRELMEVKIPELIEKFKDTEPERAQKLLGVKEQFQHAYKLDLLKSHYDENARTRKLIRRDHEKYETFCDEYNLKNDKNEFMMPDCRGIIKSLTRVLLSQFRVDKAIEMGIEGEDVAKFIILFCRTVTVSMDPHNLMDAAYMYYALKNIYALDFTAEAKTEFTAELINNICDVIAYIREKEAEFNAAMPERKSKSKRRI